MNNYKLKPEDCTEMALFWDSKQNPCSKVINTLDSSLEDENATRKALNDMGWGLRVFSTADK